MNLTRQPVYQKGQKRKSRAKARPPTAAEKRHRERVRALGCVVGPLNCSGRITIHHCGTGGGGRKDHMKVIGLCECHHTGVLGVNGGVISRREWEQRFGTEAELLVRVEESLLYDVLEKAHDELVGVRQEFKESDVLYVGTGKGIVRFEYDAKTETFKETPA